MEDIRDLRIQALKKTNYCENFPKITNVYQNHFVCEIFKNKRNYANT